MLICLMVSIVCMPPCIETTVPDNHIFFFPFWRFGDLSTFDIVPHLGWWIFEMLLCSFFLYVVNRQIKRQRMTRNIRID